MKTENLIKELSSNLSPVKRIYPVYITFIIWILFSFCFLVFFIWSRSNNFQNLYIPQYLYELIPIILCVFLSAFAAMYYSIPGNRVKKNFNYITVSLLFIWILLLVLRYSFNSQTSMDKIFNYHSCFKDIFLMSLPSGAVLIYIINRRMPIQKRWTGFWILSASSSTSAVSVAFLCSNEIPSHILVVHALPVFVMSLFGIILGSFLFREV
jgi:hypothetical protein